MIAKLHFLTFGSSLDYYMADGPKPNFQLCPQFLSARHGTLEPSKNTTGEPWSWRRKDRRRLWQEATEGKVCGSRCTWDSQVTLPYVVVTYFSLQPQIRFPSRSLSGSGHWTGTTFRPSPSLAFFSWRYCIFIWTILDRLEMYVLFKVSTDYARKYLNFQWIVYPPLHFLTLQIWIWTFLIWYYLIIMLFTILTKFMLNTDYLEKPKNNIVSKPTIIFHQNLSRTILIQIYLCDWFYLLESLIFGLKSSMTSLS